MAATAGTVAGRPQPQTTAESAGGPFVRHAPDGRRAMYVDTQQFAGFMVLVGRVAGKFLISATQPLAWQMIT